MRPILKGKGGGMTTDTAGTDQRGGRRPYAKPFVRNLDASDTESKTTAYVESHTPVYGVNQGPS